MKTLNDFVDGFWTTLVVLKQRYDSNYVAFVATEVLIESIASSMTGGDNEYSDINYGVFATDWYPVAYGNTIEEAIINLNVRVSKFISDSEIKEQYELAYSTLNNLLFNYDKEKQTLVFNTYLSQDNFPEWLKRFSTITEDKLNLLDA